MRQFFNLIFTGVFFLSSLAFARTGPGDSQDDLVRTPGSPRVTRSAGVDPNRDDLVPAPGSPRVTRKADLGGDLNSLRDLSYIDTLPKLRELDGSKGAPLVADLNGIYKDLKKSGVENPTVGQVFDRYFQNRPQSTATIMETCLFVAGMAATALTIATAKVGLAMEAKMKRELAEKEAQKSSCNERVGSLLRQNDKTQSASLGLPTAQ